VKIALGGEHFPDFLRARRIRADTAAGIEQLIRRKLKKIKMFLEQGTQSVRHLSSTAAFAARADAPPVMARHTHSRRRK
jgi:hypothetical protein